MKPAGQPIPLAFCITDLDPGGAERALLQLVTRLDRRRWEPAVYCLADRGPLAEEFARDDIPVVCLGARSARNVAVVPRLARLLRRQRPALLQSYLYHGNIVGRITARLAGVPRVVSGIRVAEKRSRFRLWLEARTDRWVDRHVCVSRAVADFSVREGALPAEKVVVIGNGVEADRFRNAEPADLAEFGIPAGSRTALFVGRLDPQKGPRVLLEAAAELFRAHEDLHLLLVGDGPLRGELQGYVARHGLAERVHFAGRRSDVPSLMQSAALLVLPSLWEGLPNVVLEAMAAGLPVVATRVEGTAELIEHGRTGLLVAPSSADSLVEAVEAVLADPSRAAEMASLAQDYVAEEVTWNSVVSAYERLYESLLAPFPALGAPRSA